MSVPALGPVSGADPVGALLGTALDGLELRQRVIADNVANLDTPNFRASSVDFESALRDSIDSGTGAGSELGTSAADPGALRAGLLPTQTPVGPNGNNVDLRKETLAASQTQFQYQLLTRAVADRYALVRTVAT